MKNKLFQSFKALLCLIWLYVLPSTALFGQSINLMNLGNGFVKAEVSGTCSTALTLNWGDGCQNTNPINPLIHQYLTCGKFTVTLTCSGSRGNILLASVQTDNIQIASVSITTNRTSVATDCGQNETLQINLSRNGGCPTPTGNVTISGSIPPGFEVIGGNSNISLTIPGSSIPAAPATVTQTLQLRPLPCSNNIDQETTIGLVATAPIGIGLSNALCNTIISSVPPALASVNLSWTFTPRAACLNIAKMTSTPTIGAGGTAQFQVTVSNTGNANAQNIQVNDLFPSELVPLTLPTTNTTVSGNMATTPIASLAGFGGNQVLNYSFKQVPIPCQTSATYKNCATAALLGCNFKTMEDCAIVNLNAPLPPLNPAFTITPINCNTRQFTAVSNTAGQTHSWSLGNGNTSILANPVNIFGNGTFTVTHTITECGVSASVTQTITINCAPPEPEFVCPCLSAGSLNINATQSSPLYQNNIGGVPGVNGVRLSALEASLNLDINNDGIISTSEHGGCIAIAGTLIVDGNITIDGANIQMQPCSEIIVRNVNTITYPILTLEFNQIFGCEKMWRGITVWNNCKLDMTQGSIKDAEIAVRVPGGSDGIGVLENSAMNIEDMLFSKNHVGIYLGNPSTTIITSNVLTNNYFWGRENNTGLLPACSANLSNYSAWQGYAGIVAQNTFLNVGNPNTPSISNTFSYLNNGIIAENTVLNVHKSTFDFILGTYLWPSGGSNPPSFANSQGIAIVTTTKAATIRNNQFNTCAYATHGVKNLRVDFTQNKINKVAFGIETIGARGFSVLDNNPFIVALTAVNMVAPSITFTNNSFNIARNIITTGPFPGIASCIGCNRPLIEVSSAVHLLMPQNKARISDNNLTGSLGHSGIRVTDLGQWGIDLNTMINCNGGEGIQLNESTNNYLYDNSVTGSTSAYDVVAATDNVFCCNYASGAQNGHRFLSGCSPTRLRNSDLNNHSFSLRCDAGTIIEPQPDMGNIFNSNSGTAAHFGSPPLINGSRFRVLSNQIPEPPPVISAPQQNPVAPWFVFEGAKPACGGASDLECIPPNPVPAIRNPINEVDRSIVKGDFYGSPYGDRTQWEGEYRLYGLLAKDLSVLAEDQQMADFYANKQTSAIPSFYALEQLILDLNNVASETIINLYILDSLINTANSSIANAYYTLETGTTPEHTILLLAEITNRMAQRQQWADAMDILLANIDADRTAKIAVAMSALEALSDDASLPAQNRKTVNRIYLQTVAQGITQFTEQQWDEINAIAYQCVLDGGNAVLGARALYRMVAEDNFDNDLLCPNMGEPSDINPSKSKPLMAQKLTIMPNPANDQIRVIGLANNDIESCTIAIFDINGKLLKQIGLTSSQTQISTSNLQDGIYFCKIERDNGTLETQRFIIIH